MPSRGKMWVGVGPPGPVLPLPQAGVGTPSHPLSLEKCPLSSLGCSHGTRHHQNPSSTFYRGWEGFLLTCESRDRDIPTPVPSEGPMPPQAWGAQERSRAARTQGRRRRLPARPGGSRGSRGEPLQRSVSQQWIRTPGSSCCWQCREVAQPLASRMPRTTAKQGQHGTSGTQGQEDRGWCSASLAPV